MTKQNTVRDRDVRDLLDAYPRIYFACHTRHVRDPRTGARLSAHQASILDHLDEVDPMTMSDLAGHMGVTVATMSLTVDRLERKRYVRRDRDPKDGRRVLVRVTAAGVRVREAKSVLRSASNRCWRSSPPPTGQRRSRDSSCWRAHRARS